MTHSYKMHFFHLIWSTKFRKKKIFEELQLRLYPYMASIIRNYSGNLIEIGGMPDHVHILIELENLDNYTDLLRELKSCSSLWVHKNFPDLRDFAWQEGFGSFTVSHSILPAVQKYIQNQEKHHSKMSFDDEYIKILKLHGIKYDERFVLG